MKIAVIGKGGSGKTTISGVLARGLARRGWEVVALDCDSNPNLGISLGMGIDETERLAAIRQALDAGEVGHASTAEEMLDLFGSPAPDRVRVAVVTRIDRPDAGCPCCGVSPEQLLGELESGRRALVADMEAGIGTLTRMPEGCIDVVLLVTEPSPKSIDVTRRAVDVISERRIASRVVVLANKVRGSGDLALVRSGIPSVEVVAIPEDPVVRDADAAGISPLDAGAASPAVAVILDLAGQLDDRAPVPAAAP